MKEQRQFTEFQLKNLQTYSKFIFKPIFWSVITLNSFKICATYGGVNQIWSHREIMKPSTI